ncbi:carboxypeptidase regulatory-like domain-containing protein [candidate division WOR-3 bacterium]|nr:carboxypeptidase regulatory-like domain-containing protein [candidate division WOR-3 bacterium]
MERLGLGMVIVIMMAGLVVCDMEHDSPYDPESPDYRGEGSVLGWVKTRTGEPIPGITLVVEPETTITQLQLSNEEGFFEFKNIAAGGCKLTAEKEGFATDSTWLEVKVGGEDTVTFFLDILPQFTFCKITTRHVLDNVHVFFQASVTDGDGPVDVESVIAWVPDLIDTIELNYDSETQTYWKIVEVNELEIGSVENLIGKDCLFLISDKANQKVLSEPVRLARVIYPTPEVISPTNFERVGKNPTLVWHRTNLNYPFTYAVELIDYEEGVPHVTIWVKEHIESDDTSVVVPLDLSPDIYSWAVWVVDEFGNRSRSKQAGFEVQ